MFLETFCYYYFNDKMVGLIKIALFGIRTFVKNFFALDLILILEYK